MSGTLRWEVRSSAAAMVYVMTVEGDVERVTPPKVTAVLFEENAEGERRVVRRVTYKVDQEAE